MKTREELKAEYEAKLAELETKEKLVATLPDDLKPSMVHVYALHDNIGSLTFGESFSRNKDKVSLETLAQLLETFPPLPTVKAKGTFTRFITEAFANSDANKEKGRETIEAIFPVTFKTNSVADYSVKAEWFTKIDGNVWSVDAYLENPSSLINVRARRLELMGGYKYVESTLSVNPVLGQWDKIKWGRGSEEWPNDFTVYHAPINENPVAWIDNVTKNLEAKS